MELGTGRNGVASATARALWKNVRARGPGDPYIDMTITTSLGAGVDLNRYLTSQRNASPHDVEKPGSTDLCADASLRVRHGLTAKSDWVRTSRPEREGSNNLPRHSLDLNL
ncbi:hypothetical protein SAMD00023353_2800790 [Rosellinia necatrix]|uniref:Uncharacterized protein n=1 Tax=Rosellinia necatrix TaxID=77044 RepID=A0A1S8A898_ROSNE|nr:hypothetical protein SAMD00023353_2800790 [Rosellinia necatrix]